MKRFITAFLVLTILLSSLNCILYAADEGSSEENLFYYFEDFDNYDSDVKPKEIGMEDYFYCEANSIGDSHIEIQEDSEGNLYLSSSVFTEIYTRKPIEGGYTFSIDVLQMQGTHQSGVFVRGVRDAAPYYEGDHDTTYTNSVGFGGIFMYGYTDEFCVNVKTYRSSGSSHIKNNCYHFDLPDGATFDGKNYTNIRVEDDGEKLEIYCADTLMCYIIMSDPTAQYKSYGIKTKCFKYATVYDADGNILGELEDTLIRGENSEIGWSTRVCTIKVDNVYLANYGATAPAEKEVETEPEVIPTEPLEEETAGDDTASYSDVTALSAKGYKKLYGTQIISDDGYYNSERFTADTKTYSYDFTSSKLKTYTNDSKLANTSLRTNMSFADGVLSCKEGKTFSFGSAIFLGDDYGIYGGELSFDLKLTGGYLALGTRLSKKAPNDTVRGIWFRIERDKLTVKEPESGTIAQIPLEASDNVRSFKVVDSREYLTFYCDGVELFRVNYGDDGAVEFRAADGTLWAKADSTNVQASGYFTLYANSLEGYIDNLSFTHTTLKEKTLSGELRDIDYSNWIATDDRDRTSPTNETTGDVKSEKQVGIFYFLCNNSSDSETPMDNTALYLSLGLESYKAYLADKNNSGGYFWAEPYFGYYRNTDEWVYRRHAYMLEEAGVDFIFIDMSNGATYPEALVTLCDTWLEMRKEGNMTPQICVLTSTCIAADLSSLMANIYSTSGMKKYGELFYQYDGKPLIFGDYSSATSDQKKFLNENFTVRGCWAWQDSNGYWNWLQEYVINEDGSVRLSNGGWGRDEDGNYEELALCVGHHPTTSKGRSYANGTYPTVDNDFGFSLDSGAGIGLEEQYKAIKQLDPDMLLITGWNEWTASLDHDNTKNFAGTRVDGYSFVDQFNTEYSRDAEPMKLRDGETTVGFGDNYFYQIEQIIRDFKGQNTVESATNQKTIDLTDYSAWSDVGPEYQDNTGDNELRSTEGYFNGYTYVNGSGRNDFDTAKVSQDGDYLYFYVKCVDNITVDDRNNWMNLFINIDSDSTNGWEGFDFVINRSRDSYYVSVESLADGWEGKTVGQALYNLDGKEMVIRVSKSVLGISGEITSFLFKWADNSTSDGDVMEFMDLGDTAPNDRYAYLYVGNEGDTTEMKYILSTGNALYELRDEELEITGLKTELSQNPENDEEDEEAEEETGTTDDTSDKASGTSKILYIVLGATAVAVIGIATAVIAKRKKK